MIYATIRKNLNSIMQRSILMTKMPLTEQTDWRKWANELVEHAKRIDWDNYGWKEAALDAFLYQCPYNVW